jgi:hypothetical protein
MKELFDRRAFTILFAVLAVVMMAAPVSQAVAQKVHRVAMHVDSSNPKIQNMALNNMVNVEKYYRAKGEKVIIELVAYGPGLHMLRSDTSKVKNRIEKISLELDNVSFAACGNTMKKMTKKEGKAPPIMSEAKNVQSGVVRLVELQERGWAYIRP